MFFVGSPTLHLTNVFLKVTIMLLLNNLNQNFYLELQLEEVPVIMYLQDTMETPPKPQFSMKSLLQMNILFHLLSF